MEQRKHLSQVVGEWVARDLALSPGSVAFSQCDLEILTVLLDSPSVKWGQRQPHPASLGYRLEIMKEKP
jgi:hypothetical protein